MLHLALPRRHAAAVLALATGLLPSSAATQEAAAPSRQPRFIANQGQWSSPEQFRIQAGGLHLFLEDRGWSLWVPEQSSLDGPAGAASSRRLIGEEPRQPRRGTALRMHFVGADQAQLVPEGRLAGAHHYLLGAAEQHRHDVPGFAAVRYENLYAGIDVRVRSAEGCFEYDLLLAPGANLDTVEVLVAGIDGLQVATDGSLILRTATGDLVQPRPITWMVGEDGDRIPVECDFVLRGEDRFGFTARDRDATRPMVVDPVLRYSSYLGGTAYDESSMIAEDSSGRIYISGYTESTDFPVTPGAVQPVTGGGSSDGFIVCIDPSLPPANQMVFATYFGGAGFDFVSSICVLPDGRVGFCGRTESAGLPTTNNAVGANLAGLADGFVGTLDPTGSALLSLTYLGGSAFDHLNSVFYHPSGFLAVSGQSASTDFPVTANAEQSTNRGGPTVGNDAVLALLTTDMASLAWSTYFGGTGDEWCYLGDLDGSGRLAVTGGCSGTDLPVTPTAVQPVSAGGFISTWYAVETYLAVIDPFQPPGQQVRYCSYLGGIWQEVASRIRVASNGDLVVSGTAHSRDFPTTAGAYQTQHGGGNLIFSDGTVAGDGYVSRIDPTTAGPAGLVWSTLIGARSRETGIDMALHSDDTVTLVGWTQELLGTDVPTTPNALRRVSGLNDGYVAHFSADGSQLLYATRLGGTNSSDGAWLAHAHAPGVVSVLSATNSTDFPVQNAVQPNPAGQTECAVTRLAMEATGTARYGAPTPSSLGAPTIHAMGDAIPGNANFGLACSKASPNAPGVLLLATASSTGTPLFGGDLFVDLNSLAASIALPASDATGESVLMFGLPTTALATLYAQYVWIDSAAPLRLSASDALRLF